MVRKLAKKQKMVIDSEGEEGDDQPLKNGTEIISDSSEIDSEDEAPEDVPLKQSKERVQAARQQEGEARQTLKLKKKQQQKEWDLKNKRQQKHKKVTDSKKNNEIKKTEKRHVSLIPQELGKDILSLAAEAVPKEDTNASQEKPENPNALKNKSKRFLDKDIVQSPVPKKKKNQQHGIEAKYIGSVSNREIGINARRFLRKHFYGNRLEREPVPIHKFKPFKKPVKV